MNNNLSLLYNKGDKICLAWSCRNKREVEEHNIQTLTVKSHAVNIVLLEILFYRVIFQFW